MISLREYAKHRAARGLTGRTLKAIQRARDSGRLPTDCFTPDGQIVDAAQADAAWLASTRSDRIPTTGPAATATAPATGARGGDTPRSTPATPAIARAELPPGVQPLAASRAHREQIAAEIAQIELDALRGKYLPVDKVVRDIENLFHIVRTHLLAVPHKVTDEVMHLHLLSGDHARKVGAIVDDHIRDALTELADGRVAGLHIGTGTGEDAATNEGNEP